MRTFFAASAAALALSAGAGSARADVIITFAGLEHGRIVNTQFAPLGVTIAANNFARSFDLACAFDTTRTNTEDPDLEDPWDLGNLPSNTNLGNVLILAENNVGAGDGILDRPDDEGSRPAGTLTFTFARPVSKFGLDLVDIESDTTEAGSLTFFRNNVQVGSVTFSAFKNAASPFFDPTIVFGNNSANRVAPILPAAFGVDGFDSVVVRLGGSGAIDNILIPAPSAAAAVALGLVGLTRRRRR